MSDDAPSEFELLKTAKELLLQVKKISARLSVLEARLGIEKETENAEPQYKPN